MSRQENQKWFTLGSCLTERHTAPSHILGRYVLMNTLFSFARMSIVSDSKAIPEILVKGALIKVISLKWEACFLLSRILLFERQLWIILYFICHLRNQGPCCDRIIASPVVLHFKNWNQDFFFARRSTYCRQMCFKAFQLLIWDQILGKKERVQK